MSIKITAGILFVLIVTSIGVYFDKNYIRKDSCAAFAWEDE